MKNKSMLEKDITTNNNSNILMGNRYYRNDSGSYYQLVIFECPRNIIEFAANFGNAQVTIENFIASGSKVILEGLANMMLVEAEIKQSCIDFQVSRELFFNLLPLLDKSGCYAVFHEAPLLKVKSSELDDKARYRILDNFKWNLEIAVPGGASSGWGTITTPDIEVIKAIENFIKKK